MTKYKLISKLITYTELCRPFTLIMPFTGILASSVVASRRLPAYPSFLAAFSAAILNAASNVNNQYFDIEIDRINKPQRPLVQGKISKREALMFSLSLYFTSLLLGWLVNKTFFFIVFLGALITFFYSAKPFRFKRHLFLSNFSIAMTRGLLLFVAGYSTMRSIFNIEPWFIGIVFFLFIFGAATTKDFSDIKGDRQFGIRTLPVVFGSKTAVKIIAPFLLMPFALIPFGVYFKIISPNLLPLTALVAWSLYIIKIMFRDSEKLSLEINHPSWKHMYLILIAMYLGFAAGYLIK